MWSKLSASALNSSLRPLSRMRWSSRPEAASRAASLMSSSGRRIQPASTQPPPSPIAASAASTIAEPLTIRSRISPRVATADWSRGLAAVSG